jgi:hypothetical protein
LTLVAARTPSRSTRLLLVGIGVVVLLGVVAVSSRGGLGHSHPVAPSRTYANYAFSAFLVLFVLAIPVAAYGYLLQAREVKLGRRRSFQARVGVSLLVTLALFVLLILRLYLRHHLNLPTFQTHVHRPHGIGGAGGGRKATYEPTFQWPVVVAFALVAGVAAAVFLNRRTRRTPTAAMLDQGLADDVATTIGGAIDDLEREADARRAVIAAYARMEGVLGRHGLRRRPSETALEYLRRVLLEVTARGDAVERLTGLFERAKFSKQDVDADMKAEAIDALRAIRDGLGG